MRSALTHWLTASLTRLREVGSWKGRRPALKVAAIYLLAGALWILFSDRWLNAWIEDPRVRGKAEIYKGWFFVVITAGLLYRLLRVEFRRQAAMIGARQEADAARKESEARFREVVETIDEVFWVRDPAGDLLYVSPGYEAIWGRSPRELDRSLEAWLEHIHPEDRERVAQASREPGRGGYDETYRVIRRDGSVRWVRERAYPVNNDKGQVVRVIGVAIDLTDNKRLEEQFFRAQRMEAIGFLAGGIAHDLNNILAPMLMVGPLLRDRVGSPEDVKLLDVLDTCGQRGAGVVRQLLAFSRGRGGERGTLEVRHLLSEIAGIVRETFPREIHVVVQAAEGVGAVVGDATQLHQVLINLGVNARDAMSEGGTLTLAAGNVVIGAEEAQAHPGMKAGRYVRVSVLDTGEGIAPEILPRIFDPFFTTKPFDQGTGLGLSTVQGIVKSHGGFITVESAPARGSAFHVHLPAAEAVGLGEAAAVKLVARGGGEAVLVVDDEPAVREATQRVLEAHGYRVWVAADGRQALEVYQRQHDTIRVVITDVMMPEMGGAALVRALRALNPELPIVVSTGLEEPEHITTLAALGVTEVLSKPCAGRELVEAVSRRLANRSETST